MFILWPHEAIRRHRSLRGYPQSSSGFGGIQADDLHLETAQRRPRTAGIPDSGRDGRCPEGGKVKATGDSLADTAPVLSSSPIDAYWV